MTASHTYGPIAFVQVFWIAILVLSPFASGEALPPELSQALSRVAGSHGINFGDKARACMTGDARVCAELRSALASTPGGAGALAALAAGAGGDASRILAALGPLSRFLGEIGAGGGSLDGLASLARNAVHTLQSAGGNLPAAIQNGLGAQVTSMLGSPAAAGLAGKFGLSAALEKAKALAPTYLNAAASGAPLDSLVNRAKADFSDVFATFAHGGGAGLLSALGSGAGGGSGVAAALDALAKQGLGKAGELDHLLAR
jgi:hypothetical protein